MRTVAPIPAEALPQIWRWLDEFERGMMDDYCPQTFEQLQQVHARLLECGKSFALYEGGQVLGAVWFDALRDGMYMGHLVFDRKALTPSAKAVFTRTALGLLFADGARKVIWELFDDNRAFNIFLRRIGASIEGKFKQATRRNGELVDVVLMATFPEDIQ